MSKKRQSRATKIVLASLLAASLSIPSFASAAEVTVEKNLTQLEATETGTTVSFKTFKPGTDEAGYMDKYFAGTGLLIKKDGTYTIKLTVPTEFSKLVSGFQVKQGDKYVDGKIEAQADGTSVVTFPVDPTVKTAAKVHVVLAAANMDTWYEFDFQPVVAEQPAEKVETPEVEAKEVGVKVYKEGTKEESIMAKYIDPTVAIAEADGKYIVAMLFPKGHYIQSFKVAGKDAVLESEDKATNERVYTFEVADVKALATAQIHIIVDEAGVKYDTNHTVQFSFDVESKVATEEKEPTAVEEKPAVTNPFNDIDNNENKQAILNLLALDIVKPADKFNPTNKLTRAQFALMIARTLELKATTDAGFKDLKGLEAERVNAINALAEVGIVEKRENFNPNGTLTRQQGALMIYRAIDTVTEGELKVEVSLPYADVATIANEEAKKAFSLLYKNGIMTGSDAKDGKTYIHANQPLTRGQMAKLLDKSLSFFLEQE